MNMCCTYKHQHNTLYDWQTLMGDTMVDRHIFEWETDIMVAHSDMPTSSDTMSGDGRMIDKDGIVLDRVKVGQRWNDRATLYTDIQWMDAGYDRWRTTDILQTNIGKQTVTTELSPQADADFDLLSQVEKSVTRARVSFMRNNVYPNSCTIFSILPVDVALKVFGLLDPSQSPFHSIIDHSHQKPSVDVPSSVDIGVVSVMNHYCGSGCAIAPDYIECAMRQQRMHN